MKWFRVEKEKAKQPSAGSCKDWKGILAEEGKHQCVYCAISETAFGGIRNFHVEHYKPKGIKRFETLTNDINNLFYACPICNTFKGDDWPNDPDEYLSTECYPDPSVHNYSHLFMLTTTAEITGKNVAARYMVEKLYLNRPQLILERREDQVYANLPEITERSREVAMQLINRTDPESASFLREYLNKISNIQSLLIEKRKTIPYQNEDISR